MPEANDKRTIISMAVVASAAATLLHEGVGHGVVAWTRGDIPIDLTSNHLSSLHPDRWVEAGGTLVNLLAGAISLLASQYAANRSNLRYFCWIFAALNLLPGSGYFLFSGIFAFGDWNEVILWCTTSNSTSHPNDKCGCRTLSFGNAPARRCSLSVLSLASRL